jgi:uncharacterized protein YchJ
MIEPKEEAVVKFIVQMTSGSKRHNNSNKKTAFMETSTFRKTEMNGPWLIRDSSHPSSTFLVLSCAC